MFKLVSASMSLMAVSAISIKGEFRPPEGTVPWHKPASVPDDEKKEYPRDYFVPHFGEDRDISDSKRHTKQAEEKLKHELVASFEPPKEPKRDYFVPHFGTDRDIVDSLRHMKQQEAIHG